MDSARTATPGLPVAVDVVVKPARRARGAEVRFYLSADARRDRGDVRLRGRPPVVPAGQALGDYRLIACVLKSCRAGRRPLRVTAAPVGTRELVASAVAAGKLKAGPVTLPVGNHGQLDITAAISNPTWHRGYYAWGGGLPQVQGTATCPTGTQPRWFGPNGYLSTTLGTKYDRPVGPDGVLQGTNTQPEGHTRTSTYSWRLVPEG